MLKKSLIFFLFIGFFSSSAYFILVVDPPAKDENLKYYPSDWFYQQRAYPHNEIPYEKYFKAAEQKLISMKLDKNRSVQKWNSIGPYNIGGRIPALDYDKVNNFLYVGAAAGGIFKSTDLGKSWTPKTDFFPSLSIGALKIDPNNINVIYCGTGEANSSTDSYPGFGIIKSTDFGETWFFSGLDSSRHIASIEIHPLNSNIIYAAASGGLYSKGDNRGIYKSSDAGQNWEKVLFINDSTSAIDVALDPSDTNIVYAAVWERLRSPSYRKAAGVSSGIYISRDGGLTWDMAVNGLPVNNPSIGRISIAVAKSNPNYIYALYKGSGTPNGNTNTFYGFYRSTDKGENWTRMPDGILSSEFSSFGWYFGLIEVDPVDFNKVYLGEIDLLRTTNGGESWSNLTNSYSGSFDQQHPDQHSLWVDPDQPHNLIVGNDGGIFTSTNNGTDWVKSYDLPVSQFYASTIDFLNPHVKYGGTQDNGTMRSFDGSTDNWEFIWGGDGFYCLVDYTDSKYIYVESQFGGIVRSTNGGESFLGASSGLDKSRTNWSTPFILDIKDPSMLFLGTYKLHKTTNRAQNWTQISGDLTRGPDGILGTITAISSAVHSDSVSRIIYVGTNDAKVSLTKNTGNTWADVTGILPNRNITDIAADYRDPSIAYVTLSGYNLDQSNPHIFRTTNYGVDWEDISSNLPDVPINSIIIDYDADSVLYIGGDLGVYYTTNLGNEWHVLGEGLPNSPVFDINIHLPTRKLVAATHGRSMFEIDISDIITSSHENRIPEFGFRLEQNYPNPFNPTTKIKYSVGTSDKRVKSKQSELVVLKVYDPLGNEVATLVNDEKNPGDYEIDFDASGLASGIYFYELKVGNFNKVNKMMLLR
jgi:photosystem II stability/assembly factor-like uncharacterized protein